MTSFEQSIKIFRMKGIRNMKLVAGAAVRDVMEGAQTPQTSAKFTGGRFVTGKIPVLTEFLRNSLQSSLNGGAAVMGATSYIAVTEALRIGDVVTFKWTAPYASIIEKGRAGVPGRFFMAVNAAKFRSHVIRRAAEVNKQ